MRDRWTSIVALSNPAPGVGIVTRATTRLSETARVNAANRPKPHDNAFNICRTGSCVALSMLVVTWAFPTLAQAPLSLETAARLAATRAPEVNTGTLLAFAYHESQLRSLALHDNTTGQSVFPASAAAAITLADTLLARGHSLDIGIMQVNSANFARTGLTVTTAFDPGESMRAGAAMLVSAYRRCLPGDPNPKAAEQQAALRCAASMYNTGDAQAGIRNGYQPRVWRVAGQIVPAIQIAIGTGPPPPTMSADTVAPEPRRASPGLEDALHATAPVPNDGDGLSDASHLINGTDIQ